MTRDGAEGEERMRKAYVAKDTTGENYPMRLHSRGLLRRTVWIYQAHRTPPKQQTATVDLHMATLGTYILAKLYIFHIASCAAPSVQQVLYINPFKSY
jgi:hypothetical protein